MVFTDIQIKRAKPQDKPYILSDGQALSLLINPDGSKGWCFHFRFAGKVRLMLIGSYDLVNLAEAREKREIARKKVANRIDPVEECKPRNWPNNSPLKLIRSHMSRMACKQSRPLDSSLSRRNH